MGWVTQWDRDGVAHQIWKQEQVNSCAIASILMCRDRVFQRCFSEDEWNLAWRSYHAIFRNLPWVPVPPAPAPMSLSQAANSGGEYQSSFERTFANDGTSQRQIESILAREGLRTTKQDSAGSYIFSKVAVDGGLLSGITPALALVVWVRGLKIVGGHAVVAARRSKAGNIVFLDPGDGSIHEYSPGSRFRTHGVIKHVYYVSDPARAYCLSDF